MLIKIRTGREIPSSEITPESVYRSRRDFMRLSGQAALGMAGSNLLAPSLLAQENDYRVRSADDINLAAKPAFLEPQIAARKAVPESGPFTTSEALTPF